MQGINSLGLVRLDYMTGETGEEGSTLVAIGKEATLLKFIKANIPGMKREGKFFIDAAGNTYHITFAPCWLIERMKSEGANLPYSF